MGGDFVTDFNHVGLAGWVKLAEVIGHGVSPWLASVAELARRYRDL